MKILPGPSFTFETPIEGTAGRDMIALIERAARTCYKSECKISANSASDFVRKLAQVSKHRSIIEHASVSVRFIVDRGISHEIVRHRIAAYSQESTRYCNYSQEKFGQEITVIQPAGMDERELPHWRKACHTAELQYFILLQLGSTPQRARSVLPTCLKTELVMTANLREWHHFCTMRASKAAHPDMQAVARPLLAEFKRHLPEIFDDIPDNQ